MSEDFWAEIFAFLDIRSSNKFVRLSRVYTFRRMCPIKLVWEVRMYIFTYFDEKYSKTSIIRTEIRIFE